MELKATDLRVGNILNYDTSEGDTVTAVIDWQDIKWISEDPKGFNLVHSPIPLTREWLAKFGLKKSPANNSFYLSMPELKAELHFEFFSGELVCVLYCSTGSFIPNEIQFVHQLQNITHALTGQEL